MGAAWPELYTRKCSLAVEFNNYIYLSYGKLGLLISDV